MKIGENKTFLSIVTTEMALCQSWSKHTRNLTGVFVNFSYAHTASEGRQTARLSLLLLEQGFAIALLLCQHQTASVALPQSCTLFLASTNKHLHAAINRPQESRAFCLLTTALSQHTIGFTSFLRPQSPSHCDNQRLRHILTKGVVT